MTSVSARFPDARRLVNQLQRQLAQLEEAVSNSNNGGIGSSQSHAHNHNLNTLANVDAINSGRSPASSSQSSASPAQRAEQLVADTETSVRQLSRLIQELQRLVSQEGPGRREQWRQRVHALLTETQQLTRSREQCVRRFRARSHNAAGSLTRQELFSGRGGSGSHHAQSNMHAQLDRHVAEHESLTRSNRAIDQQLGMGAAALQSLQQQRHTLKQARRKAWDVANVMGLSHSLLKVMERREANDGILVCACMTLSLGVLGACWYYFRYLPGHMAVVADSMADAAAM